eukprot:TRINITY_DN5852_c1_g1_i3.p1 TRINITY_DN5852_c1_g1~~TRINITY_DN5852_c1_g1_i3.p1  ORF type:complete len:475 (-),score=79.69 TRINITY_DN5852_c1_g1_i3:79-1503(-)
MRNRHFLGVGALLLVCSAMTLLVYLPSHRLPSLHTQPRQDNGFFTYSRSARSVDEDHMPIEKREAEATAPSPVLGPLELARLKYPLPSPTPPPLLGCEQNFLFAIFSGYRTFNRTIPMWDTWGKLVPDNVVFYTDRPAEPEVAAIIGKDRVNVVQPGPAEQMVEHMSAWSHIVRTRHSWEHYMRDDPTIEWLFLLDDDVYLFLDTLCFLLDDKYEQWLPTGKELVWGGLVEYMPYDWLDNKDVIKRPPGVSSSTLWSTEIVPQGATYLMHRNLVEAVYPYLDKCEEATAAFKLKSWGSQRLWSCVHQHMLVDLRSKTEALNAQLAKQSEVMNQALSRVTGSLLALRRLPEQEQVARASEIDALQTEQLELLQRHVGIESNVDTSVPPHPMPKVGLMHLNINMWKEGMHHLHLFKTAEDKARTLDPTKRGLTYKKEHEPVLSFHHLKPYEMHKIAALHSVFRVRFVVCVSSFLSL